MTQAGWKTDDILPEYFQAQKTPLGMTRKRRFISILGRSDRIRTCDLCNPIATRYQAAPHSDVLCISLKTVRILSLYAPNEKFFLRFLFKYLALGMVCI